MSRKHVNNLVESMTRVTEIFQSYMDEDIEYQCSVVDRSFELTSDEISKHWKEGGNFIIETESGKEIVFSKSTEYRLSTLLNALEYGAKIKPLWKKDIS